mmetsp:Transcript_35365/g.84495  ORF Transcript_35365/g.84495 Transcript_35365/m.84495 type:complete len:279 (+) Transcript_35365:1610-2446(+)
MAPEWPCADAMMRAVKPVVETMSTYFPFVSSSDLADWLSTSSFRTAAVPFSAAFIRGVTPSASVNRASAPLSNRSFTASTCPPTLAVIKAEMLSERVLLGSASFFSRLFITSARPSPLASHSAVTPELAGASTSAPSLMRYSTTLTCPMILASMSALMPSLSLALTSAPSFNRSLTTSMCPALAAGISGVSSSQSRTLASIFSSFSNFCTNFLSPSDAAPISLAPGELMASTSAALANCSCNGVYGCSSESHGASSAFFVPFGRIRQCCTPELLSVIT